MTEKQSEQSSRYSVKSPGRGGARPGSGRPRGSTNKIRLEDLFNSIESETGQSFEIQLAQNYSGAIQREDWGKVMEYDKVFLNKIVADKNEVTIQDSEDTIELRRRAFMEAITTLSRRDTI